MNQDYSSHITRSLAMTYEYREQLKPKPWQAFGLALLLELLAIAAIVGWVILHPAKPPVPVAVPITIESIVEEVAPIPPEPEKPPEKIIPQPPKPVTTIKPIPVERPIAKPVAQAAASEETPTPEQSPPPPPQPAIATGPSSEYIASVKAAVQAAAIYPPAAKALKFKGRVRVEFKLRDGIASQAQILTGSGLGMVDRAALQSVQTAAFPAPPTDSQGKQDVYQVWVEFNY